MDKCMFSCMGHIEELMDDLLEEVGQLPIIETVQNGKTCTLCTEIAIYQLIGSDVTTTWE